MTERNVFTSESVSMGHPDKMADQISDAVLDALLTDDPASRVACETMVTTGLCVIAGEVTTKARIDVADVARSVIKDIGYTSSDIGFDGDTCSVMVTLDRQSPDIAQGVTEGEGLNPAQGAGDQGIMFGYACNETDSLMPMPIQLSHNLIAAITERRQAGAVNWLRPDAKSQVTVEYDEDHRPTRIDNVLISTQHADTVEHAEIEGFVVDHLMRETLPAELIDDETRFLVNPTGKFVIGGPMGDCGLTGRKIIVDTYGGMGRHGGGAFSGKDPSKVDRSAAYAARWVAKTIVAAGLADRCEIQLSYAIGVAEPLSVQVMTAGSGKADESVITRAVRDTFDLTPAGIIEALDLLKPKYRQTAYHGHFGRTGDDFTWERTDRADELRKSAGL